MEVDIILILVFLSCQLPIHSFYILEVPCLLVPGPLFDLIFKALPILSHACQTLSTISTQRLVWHWHGRECIPDRDLYLAYAVWNPFQSSLVFTCQTDFISKASICLWNTSRKFLHITPFHLFCQSLRNSLANDRDFSWWLTRRNRSSY